MSSKTVPFTNVASSQRIIATVVIPDFNNRSSSVTKLVAVINVLQVKCMFTSRQEFPLYKLLLRQGLVVTRTQPTDQVIVYQVLLHVYAEILHRTITCIVLYPNQA